MGRYIRERLYFIIQQRVEDDMRELYGEDLIKEIGESNFYGNVAKLTHKIVDDVYEDINGKIIRERIRAKRKAFEQMLNSEFWMINKQGIFELDVVSKMSGVELDKAKVDECKQKAMEYNKDIPNHIINFAKTYLDWLLKSSKATNPYYEYRAFTQFLAEKGIDLDE